MISFCPPFSGKAMQKYTLFLYTPNLSTLFFKLFSDTLVILMIRFCTNYLRGLTIWQFITLYFFSTFLGFFLILVAPLSYFLLLRSFFGGQRLYNWAWFSRRSFIGGTPYIYKLNSFVWMVFILLLVFSVLSPGVHLLNRLITLKKQTVILVWLLSMLFIVYPIQLSHLLYLLDFSDDCLNRRTQVWMFSVFV